MTTAVESRVIEELVSPAEGGLPAEAARAILDLRFSPAAVARMTQLAEENSRGELDEARRAELEAYRRVGNLVNLFQAKARASLGDGRA